MKKLLALLTLSLFSLVSVCQGFNNPFAFLDSLPPVTWKVEAKKMTNFTYLISARATIAEGWHIYSNRQPEQSIGVPTGFLIEYNPLMLILSEVEEEGKAKIQEVPEIRVKQKFYEDRMVLRQVVQKKTTDMIRLHLTLTYQACNKDVYPPPKDLEFDLILY